jgi:hypothetical protein
MIITAIHFYGMLHQGDIDLETKKTIEQPRLIRDEKIGMATPSA